MERERQMQVKYRTKGKMLYFAFVDLEKAFDRVPREVTRLALRKVEVDEWLVNAVMKQYDDAQEAKGGSKAVNMKVGLHQSSVVKTSAISDGHGNCYSRTIWRFALADIVCS